MTSTAEGANPITLIDNSDKEPPVSSMAESQQKESSNAQKGDSSWMEKPENMGNSAGEWVQNTLNPVGQYTGKGLETLGKPVGGIVDPIVGGVMRSGEAFGDTLGVGYGNKEGGPGKQQEAEGQRMKEPIGGQEQTAENPLGLNRKA